VARAAARRAGQPRRAGRGARRQAGAVRHHPSHARRRARRGSEAAGDRHAPVCGGAAVKVRALSFDLAGADLAEVRGRTRWTMTVSLVAHALLLVLFLARKPAVQATPELTEITLLGPGDLESAPAGSAALPAAHAREASEGARVPVQADASFRRAS